MCDSCSMTTCALERRGRHHAQRNLQKTHSNVVPMDVDPCTVEVEKERKERAKGKNKGDPDTTAKAKVNSQSNSDTWMGIAISAVNTDTRNQTVRVRTNSSMARVCDKCGAHERKIVDCPVETVAHLESESVIEPNEEPTGTESLEWLYALEHDGETMTSLKDAPVRLFLDSGFAPHVKTLTGSSVRAR